MLTVAVQISLALLACAVFLNGWRLIRGPSLPDRILAMDTLSASAIAILLVSDIGRGTSIYFEAALLIALFGFVSTIALSKYLLRGDIIE